MTIPWIAFPYPSSSVPSSTPGSWWSIARSVVQTCGHLNFGFTAFTSNDCWSVEESPGDPVGRNGPTGNKFALAPGFESTFPIHTNGTRPVKMPVPPRTWVRRSPEAFQLKPRRGDHSAAALGSLLWSTISGLPFASSAVRLRENGLSTGFVKYIGCRKMLNELKNENFAKFAPSGTTCFPRNQEKLSVSCHTSWSRILWMENGS